MMSCTNTSQPSAIVSVEYLRMRLEEALEQIDVLKAEVSKLNFELLTSFGENQQLLEDLQARNK